MRRLETAADGWRYAIDVLRQLQEAGSEKCRANTPPPYVLQADALILALVDLKERGTVEACCGFGQILTDAVGARALEPRPEIYERMPIRPYRLKRLVNRGIRLAIPALRRENEVGQPGAAKPPEALTTR